MGLGVGGVRDLGASIIIEGVSLSKGAFEPDVEAKHGP